MKEDEYMFDVFLDSFIDSLKVLAFIFVFNVLISFFETFFTNKLIKNKKINPFTGSLFGLIPQCGVSVVSADLYVKEHITLGTIIAIFISCSDEALPIILSSDKKLKSVDLVETMPFPGFPTDLQAQYATLCCVSQGTALIVENLFETRYKYVAELKRMGADITVRGRTAVIRGVEKLHGARVTAGDLRGGAALVLAGLVAEGETQVLDLSHVDRGYADFEYKLKKLGAKIRRVKI